MKLKQSFQELKKPMVWLHYALGTLGLYLVFKYLIQIAFITELSLKAVGVFFAAYVLIDRLIHGLMGK